MPPEEDARAILRLALRHEQSLAGEQPPLSHDLERLELLAGVRLPEELLALQEFAVKARYSPEETPLSSSREDLLISIRELRAELERLLEETNRPPIGNS